MRVFYLDSDFELTDKKNAVVIKMIEDDGTVRFLLPENKDRKVENNPKLRGLNVRSEHSGYDER